MDRSRRQPTYGFNDRKGAFPQLKKLFPAEREYQRVKDIITTLACEHLDLQYTSGEQKEELKVFVNHPCFKKDAKRRVYFALKASMELHRKRRSEYKISKKKSSSTAVKGKKPSMEVYESDSDTVLSIADAFEIGTSIRDESYDIPTMARTMPDRKTDFFISFLGSCEPQLLQYLANFEIFGSDEASLRGIARDPTWTGEKRRNLIRDILAITGEAPKMHVRIIENQLDKFFL